MSSELLFHWHPRFPRGDPHISWSPSNRPDLLSPQAHTKPQSPRREWTCLGMTPKFCSCGQKQTQNASWSSPKGLHRQNCQGRVRLGPKIPLPKPSLEVVTSQSAVSAFLGKPNWEVKIKVSRAAATLPLQHTTRCQWKLFPACSHLENPTLLAIWFVLLYFSKGNPSFLI